MRKSFVLCLAIIMSLFAVTGSIAYFTDSITVQGEVKSGNLDIEQIEYMRSGNDLVAWTDQNIYPAVKKDNATTETVTVDNVPYEINKDQMNGFIDKIVVVKNNGSLPTYVRTFVAVPTSFADAIVLDWNLDGETANPTGWVLAAEPITTTINATSGTHQIEDVPYTIYYATYYTQVASGESAPPSLLGFYLDSHVNHDGKQYTFNGKQIGESNELKILVATQAAQVIPTGIGNDNQHMDAVPALAETYDKNLPDGISVGHPWLPNN